MDPEEPTLAQRLGMTVHVSPLRMKIRRLQGQFPSSDSCCIEDWLVDVANSRQATIVVRPHRCNFQFNAPPLNDFSNEELVAAICQLQCRDRPQMLRLAAQLISRQKVSFQTLKGVAERERAGMVLGELARQALRVAPAHELWRALANAFPRTMELRSPILHWTRLAEPIMTERGYNAQAWTLVA